MNLPLFIARRIYSDKAGRRKAARPAVVIATAGVAIGLAVMIVAVAVVLGFKHTIRDKVVGFGSHIQVLNFLAFQHSDPYHVCIGDSLMQVLNDVEGVSHAERFALTQGILKTDDDFLGISFKGVAQEYDLSFLDSHLKSGTMPTLTDSTASGMIVVSQTTADKLRLAAGDRVYAYFVAEGGVRARRFTVAAIFDTHMSLFDSSLCLTDLYTVRRLNGWKGDECSGAEVLVNDIDQLPLTEQRMVETINRTSDGKGNILSALTVYEAYPSVFGWLSLLDMNVWVIMALMVALAGFTMIAGLLIIILERTQMIGILKALGARNASIRHTFLYLAVFIVCRGMIIGDIAAAIIIMVQDTTGVLRLDPQTYYVSQVPMEVNIPIFAALNMATLIICVAALILPSFVVAHVSPAKAMRYE